jgi:hypothetical protein
MYELDDFEKALAHFGTRVDIICALEMGGKLIPFLLIRKLKQNSKNLSKLKNNTLRICDKCGEEKPLTSDYYQRVKHFKSGFSCWCNECNKPKPKD